MMRFLVFADFHYKKNMYASTVAHLDSVLERADREDAQFVVHLGDFCNDYIDSTKVVDTYLNNKYNMPVFGIYGNHELESNDNTMERVTPLLCNREVTFGGDGVGFWYYDIAGFRLIGLDTNYSYNPEIEAWEHNRTASWGAPKGNLYENSLSPTQLYWLDETLCDAKSKGLRVIVFSHGGLSGEWDSTPDSAAVRRLFAKYERTVLMCLNGHLHTDHFCVKDNVAYFDVNSVLNGYWAETDGHHYSDEHIFTREIFDDSGNAIGKESVKLNTLSQGKNTWFFDEPLSAVVEIGDDKVIKVSGSKTSWKYGILPPDGVDGVKPMIEDRCVKIY